MRILKYLDGRLRGRSGREEEMAEELQFHIASRAKDLERGGRDAAEARRLARAEFGAVEGWKDDCREAMGWNWLDEMRSEVRYAWRALRKRPGYTFVTVLSLALGIGVNASSWVSLNAVVLHPLPYRDLANLMTIWETSAKRTTVLDAVAPANFLDWKKEAGAFEFLAAYRQQNLSLTGRDEPERVQACSVSSGFFELLGMQPATGRIFLSAEDEPGKAAVAIVSQGFWRSRLGSAGDVLGKQISLSGRPLTVVGVMPNEFDFPLATDVWIPLALTAQEKSQRGARQLSVIGRLKRGESVGRARAELDWVAGELERRYPETNGSRGVNVTPLLELTNSVTSSFVWILTGATAFVLLLACANVANLQMARASGRRKEISLRLSLGASRLRIARQLFVESALISIGGGVAGLLLANWDTSLMRSRVPPQVFRLVAGLRDLHLDGAVIGITLLVSIAVGLLCCLPAMVQLLGRQAAGELNQGLQTGGRGATTAPSIGRMRGAIVAAEVAFGLVLLVGAGLMVRTFQHMLTMHPGFDPRNVLTVNVALGVEQARDAAGTAGYFGDVVRSVQGLPGVQAAGAVAGAGMTEGFVIEGRPEPGPDEPRPAVMAISEGYLETMRIPVLQGRSISTQDGPETPRVVVVSELVARHYWPGADPVGRRIKLGKSSSGWLTVAGVAGDTRHWFNGTPNPVAYVSSQQTPRTAMRVVVRTSGDPLQVGKGVARRIRELGRHAEIYDVKSMEQLLAEQTSGVRISGEMMSVYALIALLLAATGIYAVSSFFVVQHTHEIGVRMALGASRGDVLRMALVQSCRPASLGLLTGLGLAIVMAKVMSSLVSNVIDLSLATIAGVTFVLAAVVPLAAYMPARRAARIDPMIALRRES